MKELLDEAMRDGAIGLSTMLAEPPRAGRHDGRPGRLCQVVKRHGGLFSSHIRNEGTEVFEAVKEAIDVGRARQCRLTSSTSRSPTRSLWGRMNEIVALIDAGEA